VPYRDSKLTHLFKNYFDGDGRVNMIVCLNPRGEDYDESLHVMRFAEMTQEVKVAKTEVHKHDLGLTAGRGKAAKMYKEQQQQQLDTPDSSTAGESVADMLPPLQLFAPWPLHYVSGCNDNVTLVNFIEYLEDRMQLRKVLLNDWKEKDADVRRLIVQLEEDNVDLTKALEEQKSLMSDREKEVKGYEKKVRSITEKCDNLQRSSHTSEAQIKQLTSEVNTQKELLQKEKQEKIRLKKTLKDLTSNERLRWEKECDKRVRDKELEMEEQVMLRSEKLQQLRSVVENLKVPSTSTSDQRFTELVGAPNTHIVIKEKTCCCTNKTSTATTADEKENKKPTCTCGASNGKMSAESRPPKTPASVATPRRKPKPKPKVRSRSPPASVNRGDAAPVRSKHRRSRSTDFLLNHKPRDTLTTDTIMQPDIKFKKTVMRPKQKQLKGVSNYALTHQEEDSSGEVCTKIITGDVLQSRGGGASVQFTGMEVLKTENASGGPASPRSVASRTEKFERKTQKHMERNAKKRKSEGDDISAASSEDSWTSVETRCAHGIEGKPGAEPGLMHHSKKPKP